MKISPRREVLMKQLKYDNVNLAKIYCKTNTPFAIDKSGVTDHKKTPPTRVVRPLGIGSIEYMVSGKGTVTENDKTFQVKEGDVFILHPRQYHDYYPDPDDPWVKIWLQISGYGVPEILRMYGLSKVNHIPDFDISEDISQIREVIGYNSDIKIINRYGPIFMIELLQKISNELNSRSDSLNQKTLVHYIREFIDNSPDGNITLDLLTNNFNISKNHLIRQFKKEYNITPNEYIMNHRNALAQSLLKRTSLTMQEIATQLNFCDTAYFSEFFRKRNGISPLKFREKYKIE